MGSKFLLFLLLFTLGAGFLGGIGEVFGKRPAIFGIVPFSLLLGFLFPLLMIFVPVAIFTALCLSVNKWVSIKKGIFVRHGIAAPRWTFLSAFFTVVFSITIMMIEIFQSGIVVLVVFLLLYVAWSIFALKKELKKATAKTHRVPQKQRRR